MKLKEKLGKFFPTKLKKHLKKDWKTLVFLVVVSLIALVVAFLLEYLNPPFLSSLFHSTHKSFYQNVALGIAGSAVISFFCLYLPYRTTKQETLDSYKSAAMKVLADYAGIRTLLSVKADSTPKSPDTDSQLKTLADELSEDLSNLYNIYTNGDISHRSYDRIIAQRYSFRAISLLVSDFCLLKSPTTPNNNPSSFNGKCEEELYAMLEKYLDSVISETEVKQLFSFLVPEDWAFFYASLQKMNDTLSSYKESTSEIAIMPKRLDLNRDFMHILVSHMIHPQ